MSTFGTATTMERIDQIGLGEQSPSLVFLVSSHPLLTLLSASHKLFGWPTFDVTCRPKIQQFLRGAILIRTTELRMDAHGLTTSGDLGGSRQGILQLPWSRIAELHYAPGGAGEIGGLYAREGAWCSRCILPRLTEAQADEVIAAIAERYPESAHESNKMSRTPLKAPSLHPLPVRRAKWIPRWSALREHSR